MTLRHLLPLVTALGLGALPTPARAAPVLLDRVVATVETRHLLRSDVMRRARSYLARLDSTQRADRRVVDRALREVVTKMVEEMLIELDAERSGLRVEPTEVERLIDLMAAQNRLDRPAFLAEVAKQGLTEPAYREDLRRQILAVKWLMRKARPRVAPVGETEDEKARATDAHLAAERKALLTRLRRTENVEVRW